MRVIITRVDSSLPLPRYQTSGAAGFDFVCRSTVAIEPGALGLLPTNVVIRVPDGHVLVVALRSSTPRVKGLLMPHGVGVIDQDYCGPRDEIMVQVYNFSQERITVERGERVAQGLLMPAERCEWDEVDFSSESSRGGFGTTG